MQTVPEASRLINPIARRSPVTAASQLNLTTTKLLSSRLQAARNSSNRDEPKASIKASRGENERPFGYYKPNIWSYEHLQTLASESNIVTRSAWIEKLKEKLITVLDQVTDASTKLQIIDNICKMGLANLFEKKIMEVFDGIASDLKRNPNFIHNVGNVALCLRILRQHGYTISQGVFADFLDEEGALKDTTCQDTREVIELYEASYLALEDENLLTKANATLHENLKAMHRGLDDQNLVGQVVNALGVPQHWRAQWFGVRQQIDAYEMEFGKISMLLELAKVNFRMVQATHQRDLRDLSMWWKSLGLSDTTDEIAREIQKESGFCGAVPYLRKSWADFCKSMPTEARRYNKRYTPTLEGYLKTGWVSSSGSLLSMAILLHGREDLTTEKLNVELEEMQNLIYYTSLIIRLCNDVATTAAELERGDSPSSILCYMREAGVTEEVARLRINDTISYTWKKINAKLLKWSSVQPNVIIQILNTARVAHCFYHTRDGFGIQDGDIKRQIKDMLIEPLQLD